MALTKNVKPTAPYQQWTTITGSGLQTGDILDFYTSLGNRYPCSVMLESIGGASSVRLNVCQSVFRNPGPDYESWIGLGQGGNRPLPLQVAEVEIARPDIQITSGATMSWSVSDIAIKDMKVTLMPSGIRITIY